MQEISVFGLGKVGLTLASCLAAAGNRVLGYDVDAARVRAIDERKLDVQEPGVAERLAQGGDLLRVYDDPAPVVAGSSLTFVIVPTPSNTLGGFSLRYVLKACSQIGAVTRIRPSS